MSKSFVIWCSISGVELKSLGYGLCIDLASVAAIYAKGDISRLNVYFAKGDISRLIFSHIAK